MKTIKDIQFTPNQITQIVRTSMLFKEEPCTMGPGNLVHWVRGKKGEIIVDFDTNEVKLVDFISTPLEYCCLEGIYKGMESNTPMVFGDYFTER